MKNDIHYFVIGTYLRLNSKTLFSEYNNFRYIIYLYITQTILRKTNSIYHRLLICLSVLLIVPTTFT